VITGYNTDVEYNGVTYHVQTEDKGLHTPFILSLVYVGGAILASKRSPYDDLVAGGFDEKILVNRLQRQHKLICAAVHAGRIEDLKRMGERDAAPPSPAAADEGVAATTEAKTEPSLRQEPEDEGLVVRLVEEREFRAGQDVTIQLLVTREGEAGREPAANTPLAVKILGTTFSPQFTTATTDARGLAAVSLSLPNFTSGRAAILVKAEERGEVAELRRIILPLDS
jgi:hypothetical protein